VVGVVVLTTGTEVVVDRAEGTERGWGTVLGEATGAGRAGLLRSSTPRATPATATDTAAMARGHSTGDLRALAAFGPASPADFAAPAEPGATRAAGTSPNARLALPVPRRPGAVAVAWVTSSK
jgi:hypothetical protein